MDELKRGRELLEAARALQRRALALQAAEPADAAKLYAAAVAQLEVAAGVEGAPPRALSLLGSALMESGRAEDAVRALERAVAMPGADAALLTELGVAYLGLARHAQARHCLERALALAPDHAPARASLALVMLGGGDFAHGWDEYEWRLQTPFDAAPRGPLPYAACDSGALAGRRVLVASEQGIGDEIMFASCVPDLVAEAGQCVLECSTRLLPLFARSFPGARVIGRNRSVWPGRELTGEIDCALWAGSLPRRFRRKRPDFPGTAYLLPEAAAVARWRRALEPLGPGLKVGIAWTGGLPETARAQRSLTLQALLPLFELPGVTFVSLELHDRSAEAREISARGGARLHHPPGVAADPDKLAALIGALDLVVSVPNAAAHLAAAMGRETWVLVRGAPTWRYLWEGEQVPWYGAMRVLRRPTDGTLEHWLHGVRDALALRVNAGAAAPR